MVESKNKKYGNLSPILYLFLLALGILSTIIGCQNEIKIIESTPAQNSKDVEPNAILRLSFSTPIDKNSVRRENIYLTIVTEESIGQNEEGDEKKEEDTTGDEEKKESGDKKEEKKVETGINPAKIFGSIRFEGASSEHSTKIAFYSSKLLESGTSYRLAISDLKNEKGVKMATPLTLDFMTKNVIYETPKIKSVTLDPEAHDPFKQDTPIIVTFDKPIDPKKVKDALMVWREENKSQLAEGTEDKESNVKFEVYLIENSKGERFKKYIYFPSSGRFTEGKHTASIWVDRKSLISPMEFTIGSGYSKKIIPDNYLGTDEFLPDVDPFSE